MCSRINRRPFSWALPLVLMAGFSSTADLVTASDNQSGARKKGFVWAVDGGVTVLASYHRAYATTECGPASTCYLFGVPFKCQDCWDNGTAYEDARELSVGLTAGWGIDNRNMVGLEYLMITPLLKDNHDLPRSHLISLAWWRYLSDRPNSVFTQVGIGYLTGGFGYAHWSGISVRTGIGYHLSARLQVFLDYTRAFINTPGSAEVSGDRMMRLGMRWLDN